ncbi:TetR family transcriptional regulator [Pseudomonas alkylphenolica]|uniref:TetR family transcriptional regulator n=1 Tax=Pseudomonas alkylphenolica TaxID=237609 RepID=A0A443ZR32_9PSED|nr:TetR/AcrR family transcriptional regulator [Pseudomonas alkylphenolica]RWU21532.1 TetR family transcriptional regulator [Pseudomonas alkylphenolica]
MEHMLYQVPACTADDSPYECDTPTEKKPNEPGRRNRALILRVAAKSFASKGFAAATLSEIAELSGLPKANVNYYFHSKDNLYQQVLDSVAQRYLDAFALLNPESPPLQAVEQLIRAKLEIIRKQPWAARVFVTEMMHGARRLPAVHAQRLQDAIKRGVACLERWIARGQLVAVDARHLLISLWATTQAYANAGAQLRTDNHKRTRREEELNEAVAHITRLVLHGVLAG